MYNNITAYTYDNVGNVTEVANALGNRIVSGNPMSSFDPTGYMDWRPIKTNQGDGSAIATNYLFLFYE